MATDQERIEALKQKVRNAAKLLEWLSQQISSAEFDHEECDQPLERTKGWITLADSMRDGFIASYREEFDFRDMNDPELFPEEFNKAA